MWPYMLYRVIPGLITTVVLGGAAYAKLWFSKQWPFWGRADPVKYNSNAREEG